MEKETKYNMDEDSIFFDDDSMLDMLDEEPETACSVVWASCRALVLQANADYPDPKAMPEDLKNAYVVARAMDLVVQGMQELANEIPAHGAVH